MPIYEYQCADCGDRFEIIQKFNSGTLRKCRKCSGKLEKLISRASFQLKGGGWFDSGYGKSDKATPSENGKQASAKESSTKQKGEKETKETKDKPSKGTPKKETRSASSV